jgi:hypothetical protein
MAEDILNPMGMALLLGSGKMPNNNDEIVILIVSGVAMLFLSCYIGV